MNILRYICVESGFYTGFCATIGLLYDLGDETSCTLHFFGLGKYTKKSL